jgi:hypothetical protein
MAKVICRHHSHAFLYGLGRPRVEHPGGHDLSDKGSKERPTFQNDFARLFVRT